MWCPGLLRLDMNCAVSKAIHLISSSAWDLDRAAFGPSTLIRNGTLRGGSSISNDDDPGRVPEMNDGVIVNDALLRRIQYKPISIPKNYWLVCFVGRHMARG